MYRQRARNWCILVVALLCSCRSQTPSVSKDESTRPSASGVSSGAHVCTPGSADSSAVAALALDTVSKIVQMPSRVLRFGQDSMGFRLVTIPDPTTRVTDGMAIVRIDTQCRILSVVVTDSA